MHVAQIAARAGVSSDTVRHYVREGLLHPSRSLHSGYRNFSADDLSRLVFIRNARQLGLNLHEIREVLRCADSGDTPCPRVRGYVSRHLEEVRAQIDELQAMESRLAQALVLWNEIPNKLPRGQHVCTLIETWADSPSGVSTEVKTLQKAVRHKRLRSVG